MVVGVLSRCGNCCNILKLPIKGSPHGASVPTRQPTCSISSGPCPTEERTYGTSGANLRWSTSRCTSTLLALDNWTDDGRSIRLAQKCLACPRTEIHRSIVVLAMIALPSQRVLQTKRFRGVQGRCNFPWRITEPGTRMREYEQSRALGQTGLLGRLWTSPGRIPDRGDRGKEQGYRLS